MLTLTLSLKNKINKNKNKNKRWEISKVHYLLEINYTCWIICDGTEDRTERGLSQLSNRERLEVSTMWIRQS